jgi:hypothetical protein
MPFLARGGDWFDDWAVGHSSALSAVGCEQRQVEMDHPPNIRKRLTECYVLCKDFRRDSAVSDILNDMSSEVVSGRQRIRVPAP